MKTIKSLLITIVFLAMCYSVSAQFGIGRAVNRGINNAVEKKAEEATTKAIDDAAKKSEEEQAKEKEAEKAQKTQQETEDTPEEIPQVSNTPYTPSESEYAFFAMKEGAVQVFVSKDAKGKTTAQTRNTIKSITGDKNAFAIAYETEILDEKGKSAGNDKPLVFNYRVVIKDDIMYLDMKEVFGAIEGLDDVQATGTAMKIPSNLVVRQKLPDASVKIKMGFINLSATMTEIECVDIENVIVEAGTYKCYKVSQKNNVTAVGSKHESTSITWYAKGVGAVKTETYDKKGKLLSTQELVSHK
ncbi:MAG: hypothetical protein FWC34_08050 [Bacteroidetes bacterium]|nr:hypothetical protein [Bacteroidota bacterium]MCL2301652.1 hypothetical protein [Lentimicrobiaceae bacterium]